ncbi:hypothetical protein [Urbifossiella limnaea]|uniref:Uncharacterized protein n=1 Tax=Urbifossiella limnaea TaxID=2528023 RepID=A0A517XLK5_9BACT|nr:hypothetical protein [Urbifossiella limnaea]QDU18384.1 hypothetical protein ETAA1_02700 [Urbifossiella limnaea]
MPPARADLLARLPAVGFLPPEDAAPWSVATRAAEFRAAVEGFAAAYWSLPPAKRGARYDRLSAAAYGPAAARLGLLESGLDVTREAGDDPTPTTLDQLVRELAAIRRRARVEKREARRTTAVVFVEFLYDTLDGLGVVLDRRSRRRGHKWSLKGFLADRVNQSLLFCSGVAGVAVIALVLVGQLSPGRAGAGPPTRTTFTPAEVQSYQAYHVAPRFRRLLGPPAGYADWVAAGKPAGKTP